MPDSVRVHLKAIGYVLPLEDMEEFIRTRHEWIGSSGSFFGYKYTDGFGRIYKVYRQSIHPAVRVGMEWGSLVLNDKTAAVCEGQGCTDWLGEFFKDTAFMPAAHATLVRAFGMGLGLKFFGGSIAQDGACLAV